MMHHFRYGLLCLAVLFSTLATAQETGLKQPSAQHPELVPKEHAVTDVGMRLEREGFYPRPTSIDSLHYVDKIGVDLSTVMGVVAVFGLLASVSAVAIFFAARRHQATLDLVRDIIATGQPLPESVSMILKDGTKTSLAPAIQLLAFGVGLTIMLAVLAEPKTGAVGVLFICIGAGQLLVHFLEQKRQND